MAYVQMVALSFCVVMASSRGFTQFIITSFLASIPAMSTGQTATENDEACQHTCNNNTLA